MSGDVISKISSSTTADDQVQNTLNNDNLNYVLSDTDSNLDDSIFVSSDLLEDLEELYALHIVSGGNIENIVRNRRTPRDLANLGNFPQREFRLRSGCI